MSTQVLAPFPSQGPPGTPSKDPQAQSHSRKSSLVTPIFPPQVKPNNHPYAIKTTSTALLSRSGSSAQRDTAYHHYLPPSPSPTRQETQAPAAKKHRYSRSMTDAGPQGLPLPPSNPSSRPASASPRKNSFVEHEGEEAIHEGVTPPRRRAESTSEVVFRDMHLPEDPKSWDADQLAEYILSRIRSGTGEKIAGFVRERRISGKAFLRLNERDLDEFGLDENWAQTMLEASRSLRQSTLRGRIWGFGNTQESSHSPRSRSDSVSSTESFDDGPRYVPPRNRVKGMVASFEASSGSEQSEDERSRSSSPTKLSRGLPQRPKTLDLFNPHPQASPTWSASPVRQEFQPLPDIDDGSTVKPVPYNARAKELPRLLPFPPPPPQQQPMPVSMVLEPMHTGAGFPLPASPEMGYRPQSRPARLLPVPPGLVPSPAPEVGQVLHHPRPVRGGPPEVVKQDELERAARAEEEGEKSIEELLREQSTQDGGVSGVEAWEMELGATVKRIVDAGGVATDTKEEQESGGVGSFVIGRTGRRGRKALQPKARPSAGEGLSNSASSADEDGPAPMLERAIGPREIGSVRKEGERRGIGRSVRGPRGGGGKLKDMFIMDKAPEMAEATTKEVEAQTDEESGREEQSLKTKREELEQSLARLEEERTQLATLEARVVVREKEVGAREVELREREDAFTAREAGARSQAEALEQRTIDLAARERTLKEREEALDARERQLDERESSLNAKEKALVAREEEVDGQLNVVKSREEQLRRQETTVNLATRLVKRLFAPIFGAVDLDVDTRGGQSQGLSVSSSSSELTSPQRKMGVWSRGLGWMRLDAVGIRAGRAPYFVLLGLGVCAVMLRVVLRRALIVGVGKTGLVRGVLGDAGR